jgi:hypothetical protein
MVAVLDGSNNNRTATTISTGSKPTLLVETSFNIITLFTIPTSLNIVVMSTKHDFTLLCMYGSCLNILFVSKCNQKYPEIFFRKSEKGMGIKTVLLLTNQKSNS